MSSSRRSLLRGFLVWLTTAGAALQGYVLTLDSFSEWDWFFFFKGALGVALTGLGMLVKFFTGEAAKPVVPKPIKRLDPVIDEIDFRAPVKPERIDIPLLRKELRADEGVMHEIYLDSLQNKTAGIGRLLTPDMPEYNMPVGTKISEQTVERWFSEDVSNAIKDAQSVVAYFDSHPRTVKHALVNLAFSMGQARLSGFKNTLSLINQKRYSEASTELLNSRYAEQVKNRAMRVSGWIASAEDGLRLA